MVYGFCWFSFLQLRSPLEFCGWLYMYWWDLLSSLWVFHSVSDPWEVERCVQSSSRSSHEESVYTHISVALPCAVLPDSLCSSLSAQGSMVACSPPWLLQNWRRPGQAQHLPLPVCAVLFLVPAHMCPLHCIHCVSGRYLLHFRLRWLPWRAEGEFSESFLFSQFEVIRYVFVGFFPLQITNRW